MPTAGRVTRAELALAMGCDADKDTVGGETQRFLVSGMVSRGSAAHVLEHDESNEL